MTKRRTYTRGPMACQKCGWVGSDVIDSRPSECFERINRRRRCKRCSAVYGTVEIRTGSMDPAFDLLEGLIKELRKSTKGRKEYRAREQPIRPFPFDD